MQTYANRLKSKWTWNWFSELYIICYITDYKRFNSLNSRFLLSLDFLVDTTPMQTVWLPYGRSPPIRHPTKESVRISDLDENAVNQERPPDDLKNDLCHIGYVWHSLCVVSVHRSSLELITFTVPIIDENEVRNVNGNRSTFTGILLLLKMR